MTWGVTIIHNSPFIIHNSQDLPPPSGNVGVLLVNLGSPAGVDYWSVWRYLRAFLTDRRVIEWPRVLWWPILYGIVLTCRSKTSGEAYKRIWNARENEAPLRVYTREQSKKLAERFASCSTLHIDWAMRYGTPSISSKIHVLKEKGCDRILVFPLYPQYAASTTATVQDEVCKTVLKMRWQPALRMVPPYYDDPVYIDALADAVQNTLASEKTKPSVILASFHGIPEAYSRKGDPYYQHCVRTTQLLRKRLQMSPSALRLTFQSRFGPEEWLRPYTDETIKKLAQENAEHIAVITPGFVSDCLETTDEIAREGAQIFQENGGNRLHFIPCLNASTAGIDVLEHVLRRELSGWI